MVRKLREEKPKKKGQFFTILLFIFNVFLWGSAIYLWRQAVDLPPSVREDFATGVEVYVPTMMQSTFQTGAALTAEDVDVSLYSDHALLINLDTGEILFDHRGHERAYPASVTKIMTVLLGIEHASGDEVIINADFDALHQAQSAMAGFTYGETRTLSEVLHGALLSSGGDATSSLAHHISGSYEGFVELMNETARRLGMHDTHFMNTTGLHHEQHYTTAYDIALLLEYALTHSQFREIFTAEFYPFINSAGVEQVMESILFRQLPTTEFEGGKILGGMTGFTTPAGLCLASLATNGTHEFALITFGAPTTEAVPAHVQDALALYEYFLSLDE